MPYYPAGGGGSGATGPTGATGATGATGSSGSVRQMFMPEEAQFLAATFPQYLKNNGTSFPISYLAFDAGADEAAFFKMDASLYGSGDITVTIYWCADTATSGDIVWGASLAAYTPDTDSTSIEVKALAAEITVTDTQLGTTAKRLQIATITITGASLDSIVQSDGAWMRIRRVGTSGSDNMAGDGLLERVMVAFTGP